MVRSRAVARRLEPWGPGDHDLAWLAVCGSPAHKRGEVAHLSYRSDRTLFHHAMADFQI